MASEQDRERAVIDLCRKAISDEFSAIYQYYVGSILIDDENEDVIEEFVQHRDDEMDHATELGAWLKEFSSISGRLVPRSIDEALKVQWCGYVYPSADTRESLLLDGIKAEKCAVNFYQEFIKLVHPKSGLGEVLEQILEKEKEHLRDLEKLK